MSKPVSPDDTDRALDQLDAVIQKAIAHARGREIDEQQVALARLADLATELRAARDLLAYAREAGEVYREQAAVFTGQLVGKVTAMACEHGASHGLEPGDVPPEAAAYARVALDEERVRALGRIIAEQRGSNDGPLDEVLELTRETFVFSSGLSLPLKRHGRTQRFRSVHPAHTGYMTGSASTRILRLTTAPGWVGNTC